MLSSDIFINIILKPTPKLFLVYSGASTNATYKKSFIPSTPLAQRLIGNYAGNKAKGRISKRVFQENKAREIFRKTNISYPLIRCAYPFWKLPKKGGQIFSIKRQELVKYGLGEVVLKKGVSLIFILTSPFQCYLSLGISCVCLLLTHIIPINIFRVSWVELSHIGSNQQQDSN